MKINVLLTGRGNNSLKDKNILDVFGKPVMYYPAMACKNSKFVSNCYCSSDDKKILNIAESMGYVPIKRPDSLALPTSQHIDCVVHAIEFMKENNDSPDILVVALANNVSVTSKMVDDCIKMMLDDDSITCAIPVYQDNDHHPLRAKRIDSNGNIQTFEKIEGRVSTNRQDLDPCYFVAHNIWVLRTESVLHGNNGQPPWDFMGDNIKPYVIEESVDIHDEKDLIIAENWIKNYY